MDTVRAKATRNELMGAGGLVLCVVLWLFNHYGAFDRQPTTPAPLPQISAADMEPHENYPMHKYTIRVTGNGEEFFAVLSPMSSSGKITSETLEHQRLPAVYTRECAYCSVAVFNPLPRKDEWWKVEIERDGLFVAESPGPDGNGAYKAEFFPKISDALSGKPPAVGGK